jgi:hypothetical protein
MTEAHPISQTLESRLLGVEEAALFLGVTARSLYRLVDKGMLTPVCLPGFQASGGGNPRTPTRLRRSRN